MKLPTEEQILALLHARAAEIMRSRNLDRVHLTYYIGTIGDITTAGVSFTPGRELQGIFGKTLDEVLARYDAEHSPAAKLERARRLRDEAATLEHQASLSARHRITDETRILMVEDNDLLTWGELVRLNQDTEEGEIARWKDELALRGETQVGGGAAPAFTLRVHA